MISSSLSSGSRSMVETERRPMTVSMMPSSSPGASAIASKSYAEHNARVQEPSKAMRAT